MGVRGEVTKVEEAPSDESFLQRNCHENRHKIRRGISKKEKYWVTNPWEAVGN